MVRGGLYLGNACDTWEPRTKLVDEVYDDFLCGVALPIISESYRLRSTKGAIALLFF